MSGRNSRDEGDILQQGNQSPGVRNPRIDLFETEEHYCIRLSLPGVKKEQLDINFTEKGDIEVRGIVTTNLPETLQKVLIQEIYQGPFYRKIYVPRSVNKEGVTFSYNNGILEIIMKKGFREG